MITPHHTDRTGHVDHPALVDIARSIEDDERLDPFVTALRPAAEALVASPGRRALLLGEQLGHAVHPLLTDAPLGAWMSALVLDLVGGRASRPAARRLVGLGILTAVPTALTGMAEWAHTSQRDSRTGVVHAASNTVALMLFTASYISRRRGHFIRGTGLALAGTVSASAGGYLGAHLAIARNAGSRNVAFADSLPPTVGAPAGDSPLTA